MATEHLLDVRSSDARCATAVDRFLKRAHDGRMSRPSAIEKRIKRQAAELLAIIQTEPGISTAMLASRAGMSEAIARKRLAYLRSEGKVTGKRGRALPVSAAASPGLSLEERVSTIERLLLKLLAQQDGDSAL